MEEGLKSRSLVSKRTSFFGNTRCLYNFRELAPALATPRVLKISHLAGHTKILNESGLT